MSISALNHDVHCTAQHYSQPLCFVRLKRCGFGGAGRYEVDEEEEREKEFMMADDPSMRARWDVVDLRTLVRCLIVFLCTLVLQHLVSSYAALCPLTPTHFFGHYWRLTTTNYC